MHAILHEGAQMITDRIDAITKIPESYRFATLPAPKSVKIEISPRCIITDADAVRYGTVRFNPNGIWI